MNATTNLTDLLNTATSAIARQGRDPKTPCEYRKAAGRALEAAQAVVAANPRLKDRAAWAALIKARWTELG